MTTRKTVASATIRKALADVRRLSACSARLITTTALASRISRTSRTSRSDESSAPYSGTVTTTIATSSQCARRAARFLGATQSTNVSSAAKIAQINQFAVCANACQPSDFASRSTISTGIIASVAPSTKGSNGCCTLPESLCVHAGA